MNRLNILESGLARFDLDNIAALSEDCRPRILIVADGSLNFAPGDGLGLTRFVQAITTSTGVTNKPLITLAHRGVHVLNTVKINGDEYTINPSFKFSQADPEVNIKNYDQLWLFGFLDGKLPANELEKIVEFMNSGGGVFATGDHLNIGQQMCGSLPRIRHMREWSAIPMGSEEVEVAVKRIDTVVSPGLKNVFEFDDQSDDIPQRIYPNFTVTATAVGWEATVHQILLLSNIFDTPRNSGVSFPHDVLDMLPDHPHESICKDVTDAAVLTGKYTDVAEPFDEFPVSVTGGMVKPEIVAYAVSGGRTVFRGVWKPPVKPQVFAAISAYDGTEAKRYEKTGERPGRIVCESTWHHYVNINLDGTSTGRMGLGVWSGGQAGKGDFTPSLALENIFAYYRNIVKWLQPANRVGCNLWWILVAMRYHPLLIEELLEAPRLKSWPDFVGLGLEAAKLINLTIGPQAPMDMVTRILRNDGSKEATTLADLLNSAESKQLLPKSDDLPYGALGMLLADLAIKLPVNNQEDSLETTLNTLRDGPSKWMKEPVAELTRLIKPGIREYIERANQAQDYIKGVATSLNIE